MKKKVFLGFFRFYSNQIVHLVIDIAFSNIAAIKFDFYCYRSWTMEFIDDVDDDRQQRRLTQDGPVYAIQLSRTSPVPDWTAPCHYFKKLCLTSRVVASGSFDSISIWSEQWANRLLLARSTNELQVRCGRPPYTILPGFGCSGMVWICDFFSVCLPAILYNTHTHSAHLRVLLMFSHTFPLTSLFAI